MTYYLAIDIGASGGRHILGSIENRKLKLEEVYRFENGYKIQDGSLVWDIESLVGEVKAGIKKCAEIGKLPKTVAIDTWGVDYVLFDKNGNEMLPVYCYRDPRTEKSLDEVEKMIPAEELYKRTGAQKQSFNTIYQLYADKLSGKLDKANSFLMMPEYLAYKLCGKKMHEYTIAGTTGLVNAQTKTWDLNIIEKLGFDKDMFTELHQPGEAIGNFTDEIKAYAGFDATVVFAPGHDTASAVAACPLEENDVYISSGTWSLFGIESKDFIVSDEGRIANFGNELGINKTVRYLKNYMGMWLLQSIRRNINKSLTYDEMMLKAQACDKYSYIDVNHPTLTAPESMIDAIKNCLNSPDMTLDEVLASVYHSLAKSYTVAVEEIEKLTGKSIKTIHIVGGGSQDKYLNKLTSEYTGREVTAGPVEATSVGNLISQLLYDKACKSMIEARELVKRSFDIKAV